MLQLEGYKLIRTEEENMSYKILDFVDSDEIEAGDVLTVWSSQEVAEANDIASDESIFNFFYNWTFGYG